MSAFAAAAQDEDGDEIKELQWRLNAAKEDIRTLTVERERLRNSVERLHAAKGRYHTQLAICDLFDLVGLKNERPTKGPRND